MNKKLYVHNFAGEKDLALIEQNKIRFIKLLAPVLNRKIFKGKYSILYDRDGEGLYRIEFKWKQTNLDDGYIIIEDFKRFENFIYKMKQRVHVIRKLTMTTFYLVTPSFSAPTQAYDMASVYLDIIQFKIIDNDGTVQ